MRARSCCSFGASGRNGLMRYGAFAANVPAGTRLAMVGAMGKSYTLAPPAESARVAGLRYVSDADPGIERRRAAKGFRYFAPGSAVLRDPATLKRIRALAIPPAWTDVWICPRADGHLQATGRDARYRKQYRYRELRAQGRQQTKHWRLS